MAKNDKNEAEKNTNEQDARTAEKIIITQTAQMLGDTWFLLVIQELLDGKKRFNEIAHNLAKLNPKTNPQMLSNRLKALEQQGFLTRHAYAEVPPRVEYELTEKGMAVADVLKALGNYGKKYIAEDIANGTYGVAEHTSTTTPTANKDSQPI